MALCDGRVDRNCTRALLRTTANRRDLMRFAALSTGVLGTAAAWPAASRAQSDDFGFAIEPSQNDGGTSIMQLGYESNGLNPLNYDGWVGASLLAPAPLMFESLVGRHPQIGEFIPVLATGWETSEDGLTWTFTLRDGVTWHDGTPFTAADVVFTYETLMIPEVNSYARELVVDTIAAIEAPDERTVVMTATEVNSEFLTVALEWLVPAHIWADVAPADILGHPGTTGEDPGVVVGTGPFKLVERLPLDHTTLEGYAGYWRGQPKLATIIFQHASDSTLAEPLLRAGDLDWGWVSFEVANQFKTLDSLTLHQYPSLDIIEFGFNLDPERTTLFQDKRVRQAMLYALDRQAIVDAGYHGLASVAETYLLPDMWNHDADGIEIRYAYDPERAAQLLDEAGWTLGDDGVRVKDGERFAFTYLSWDYLEQTLSVAKEFWRAVGIEMDLQLVTIEVLGEMTTARDFDMTDLQTSVRGSGYDALFFAMHSEGGNITGYRNPRADELLDMIKQELDDERRIPLFTELQNLYLDELPALPIVHDWDNRVVNNRLHNMFPNPYRTEFNPEMWWIDA